MDIVQPKNLLNDVLECRDLHIVLKNRHGEQYIESYHLPVIVYSNGMFWAKFRNVHSIDNLTGIISPGLGAYAYSNYCNVVSCSFLSEKKERYYSLEAYSHVEYIVRGEYEKMWCSELGGNIEAIRRAVETGRRIKLRIEDGDNYTYIVNAHTVEVYENCFVIDSEFDSIPERLRHFLSFKEIESKLTEDKEISPQKLYSASRYSETQFYHINFIYSSKGGIWLEDFLVKALY
jgi:hypothetical protein